MLSLMPAGLNQSVRFFSGLVLIIIVLILWYMGLYRSVAGDVQDLKSEISQLEFNLAAFTNTTEDIGTVRAMIDSFTLDLASMKERISEPEEIPEIIRRIRALSDINFLELNEIKPTTQSKNFVKKDPLLEGRAVNKTSVIVVFSGKFEGIATFMTQLAKEPFSAAIYQFKLVENPDVGLPTLEASLVIDILVWGT